MKVLLKNCFYPNNLITFIKLKQRHFLPLLLFFSLHSKSQTIANYVNNGGFEDLKDCNYYVNDNKLKYWSGIDTTKFNYSIENQCLNNMPYGGWYQYARSGVGEVGGGFLCSQCTYSTNRSYMRNKLKGTLSANKTYCVKFYVNVKNGSPKGVDAIQAYFGDNTLDTVKLCFARITYLIPQISNPTGNVITDTLNWIPVTGTFVANGTERFMVIGNFKSDAATNTAVANSTVSGNWCDLHLDDVSCIDIDLPAYAGPDLYALPGNTVYLGRPRDVGIDEACLWYKLPNTTTAIDTAAGITVTIGAQTATYMVKQDICGNIKYDTVVVYSSAVGLAELQMKGEFKIIPNPAQDYIVIKGGKGEPVNISISDPSGRILQEEKIIITDTEGKLDLTLQNGIYFVTLTNGQKQSVVQKLIISK
jgi:hypothetical protein